MKHLSHGLNRIAAAQNWFCSWSMLLLGVAMTLTILIQIFFRFVIYRPVPWSEELARYLMVWMGMLGSVIALRKGRHIGVTSLVDRLDGWRRATVRRLVACTIIVFLGIIGWQGLNLAIFNASQLSAAMEISMTIPYAAIPVGAAMMIIELVAGIFKTAFPVDTPDFLPESKTTEE
jgi:TRAP-type C4-dicarboxylate transport system permease small subunit